MSVQSHRLKIPLENGFNINNYMKWYNRMSKYSNHPFREKKESQRERKRKKQAKVVGSAPLPKGKRSKHTWLLSNKLNQENRSRKRTNQTQSSGFVCGGNKNTKTSRVKYIKSVF
jgi:hypothetical protein